MQPSHLRLCLVSISALVVLVLAGCKPRQEGGQQEGAGASQTITHSTSYDWLAAQQNEDGSFSNPEFPAMTALALQALHTARDSKYAPVIDKAVAFVLTHVQPNGGIYTPIPNRRGGGLANYNTAICMTALASLNHPDLTPVLLNARAFMAESQELNDGDFKGGFGYDRDNDRAYADITNTSFALEAMRATQKLEDERPAGQDKVDINWEAALSFVEGLQNNADSGAHNAGGFHYTYNDARWGAETNTVQTVGGTEERVVFRSFGSVTYQGILSMIHCQLSQRDPRVIAALEWCERHWTLDENAGAGQQGIYFFYNIMARALSAAKADEIETPEGRIAWRMELAEKLASLMLADGTWLNESARFMENDPVLVTAYVLIALAQ